MKKVVFTIFIMCVLSVQGCASWKERYKWQIGMTKEQVLKSVDGEPDRKLKKSTASGTDEVWVYAGPTYLYFDKAGILRRIDSPY